MDSDDRPDASDSLFSRTTQDFSRLLPEFRSVHGRSPQSSQHHVLRELTADDYAYGFSPDTINEYSDRFHDEAYPPHPQPYISSSLLSDGPGASPMNEYVATASYNHLPLSPNGTSAGHVYEYTGNICSQPPSSNKDVSLQNFYCQQDPGYSTTAEQDESEAPSILINPEDRWSSFSHRDVHGIPSPYAYPGNITEFRALRGSNIDSTGTVNIEMVHVEEPPASSENKKSKKKAKMHQCEICSKQFPRPSALKTHIHSHTNHKPFSCEYPGCNRTFTVRSNAKRHLRTHGIAPDDAIADSLVPRAPTADFEVNFDEPIVQEQEHELYRGVPELKWMPPSLSSRTNVASLMSVPEGNDSDWEDRKEDPCVEECTHSLTIPLRPVEPSEPQEERNSFEEAGTYPYRSSQFKNKYRRLPGPAQKLRSIVA